MNTIKELLNNQQEDWSLDQKFYKDTSIFDLEKHNIFYREDRIHTSNKLILIRTAKNEKKI